MTRKWRDRQTGRCRPPPVTSCNPTLPTSSSFPHSSKSWHPWRPSPQHLSLWGTLHIQITTTMEASRKRHSFFSDAKRKEIISTYVFLMFMCLYIRSEDDFLRGWEWSTVDRELDLHAQSSGFDDNTGLGGACLES